MRGHAPAARRRNLKTGDVPPLGTVTNMQDVAEYEPDLRPRHQRHLRRQTIGKPHVIRVDERDQQPFGVTQTEVARRICAGVRLIENDDLRSETLEHSARSVG